ncbi:type II toxin-antitoxin system RelE/ParE family toxin [Serratia sp. DD3]|uniref:type II toxin-antitoxin system RelE/ParE family toxin n=1 Tax=Serratia sp. DD3 TaxID=1410619 RepID=UPI0003C5235D|nr:type II toxin-antitoxin system RelE/ParE family toxin [Serratia sp. DD3]KEY56567.1 toxin ParE [Serratia sp. DD3]KEY56787.1 toxin ParE [Serratia sp. DD3]KEY58280.1 toxin ParE [Serratia sp. DD3]KEY59498.1 toxin ParE [Serratia sp. DD3]
MKTYLLTVEAEADLRGIIRYTRKQWGTTQVRNYIARLEHGIANLAAGRGAFKDMSELFPELRMAHCEHHYVFCLPRGSAPALVVAIFHERMDLMTRQAERFSKES